MTIDETKYVLVAELQPHETAESLDQELPEFFGMLLTFDNTQERTIVERDGKRYATCGFATKESADEYMKHRDSSGRLNKARR